MSPRRGASGRSQRVAQAQHQHTLNLSPRNLVRDDEKDMEAAAEKAAQERGKRLTKRGASAEIA